VNVSARMRDVTELLRTRKISELPVVDDAGRPVGLLDITDLFGLAEAPLVPPSPGGMGFVWNPSPLGERGRGEGESGPVTGGPETGLDSQGSPSPLTPLPQGRGGPAKTQSPFPKEVGTIRVLP